MNILKIKKVLYGGITGIKQEELASSFRVSSQTIGSLENGRFNPAIQLSFKIARYFGKNVEEIIYL